MEIFKVLGVGIIGAVVVMLMRSSKPEYAVLVSVATGLLLLIFLVNSLNRVVEAFTAIVDKSGLNANLFGGILKIIGVGYLTEYSSSISTDCGADGIADKIQLGGKLTIFLLSLPIFNALIDVVGKLVL